MAPAQPQHMSEQPDRSDGPREIRDFGLRKISYTSENFTVSATEPIKYAGDPAAVVYAPHLVDEMGLVPAEGFPERLTGQSSKFGRVVRMTGEDQQYRSVSIPPEVLEALGYDVEAIRNQIDDDESEAVHIRILAGENLIAFERPEQREVDVDESEFDPESERDYSDRRRAQGGKFAPNDTE